MRSCPRSWFLMRVLDEVLDFWWGSWWGSWFSMRFLPKTSLRSWFWNNLIEILNEENNFRKAENGNQGWIRDNIQYGIHYCRGWNGILTVTTGIGSIPVSTLSAYDAIFASSVFHFSNSNALVRCHRAIRMIIWRVTKRRQWYIGIKNRRRIGTDYLWNKMLNK